ncbi:MAG: GNAT family N-acetyltransferase [Chloroflexi bacterium]|nr:GNAT family N-acetyltransferase [Chloroflexota bacterium]
MKIRSFTMEDYEQVWELWEACKLSLGPSDSRTEIEKKLKRDPDLFLVVEENRAILGVAIGSWDGRVGSIYNHAVEPRCRRTGIGSGLMRELEHRLMEKGARRINLLVGKNNLEAQDFYEAGGFRFDDTQLLMTKELNQG